MASDTSTSSGTTTTSISTGYSPFDMDTESAQAIGGALLLVMAVAFVIRQIINTLLKTEKDE